MPFGELFELESEMSGMPEARTSMMQPVSELMDGEANISLTESVCLAWRDDAALRETWRTWHVIGDVLRSEDLAPLQRQGDAQFLSALRQRLNAEPAILAPQPPLAARPDDGRRAALRRRRAWTGGMAIAAGFVAVAGALVVLQPSSSAGTDAATMAKAAAAFDSQSTAALATAATAAASPNAPQVLVVNGQLIRDARLDQYLAAHKNYSAFGMPAGFTRNAPADASGR